MWKVRQTLSIELRSQVVCSSGCGGFNCGCGGGVGGSNTSVGATSGYKLCVCVRYTQLIIQVKFLLY